MIRQLIAKWKLDRALAKRKAYRLAHSEATKRGKLAAQRKLWANDPMRGLVS